MAKKVYKHEDIDCGMWKFRKEIHVDELTKIAKQWAKEEPEQYLDLHVRRCSKDQFGIGFQRVRKEGETHKQFFERVKDFLLKKFGVSLAGWDIGQTTWLIK